MKIYHNPRCRKSREGIKYLESKKMIVNIRRSRGKDIDAACGQLANKLAK